MIRIYSFKSRIFEIDHITVLLMQGEGIYNNLRITIPQNRQGPSGPHLRPLLLNSDLHAVVGHGTPNYSPSREDLAKRQMGKPITMN